LFRDKKQILVDLHLDKPVDLNDVSVLKEMLSLNDNPILKAVHNAVLMKWFMIIVNTDPINGSEKEKIAYTEARNKINAIHEVKRIMNDVIENHKERSGEDAY